MCLTIFFFLRLDSCICIVSMVTKNWILTELFFGACQTEAGNLLSLFGSSWLWRNKLCQISIIIFKAIITKRIITIIILINFVQFYVICSCFLFYFKKTYWLMGVGAKAFSKFFRKQFTWVLSMAFYFSFSSFNLLYSSQQRRLFPSEHNEEMSVINKID